MKQILNLSTVVAIVAFLTTFMVKSILYFNRRKLFLERDLIDLENRVFDLEVKEMEKTDDNN